jgi:hypothetical protein
MRAEDWLHLYQLFDRPAQVKVLRDYLAEVRSRSADRIG